MAGAIGRFLAGTLALRFVPTALRTACFLSLGVTGGAALLAIHVSRAPSYLSDAPETCTNCHVMTTQYVTWQHSSHARSATCNDCHVPHDTIWSHYFFKAKDGLRHAAIFTLRREPQVIRLSEGAVPVVEENCRRCHGATIEEAALAQHARGDLRCWECHRETPHGSVRSLSAVPGVFQPRLAPVTSPDQRSRIGGRVPRREDGLGIRDWGLGIGD
jgi:cytochrome c nitrite reductase small subunit